MRTTSCLVGTSSTNIIAVPRHCYLASIVARRLIQLWSRVVLFALATPMPGGEGCFFHVDLSVCGVGGEGGERCPTNLGWNRFVTPSILHSLYNITAPRGGRTDGVWHGISYSGIKWWAHGELVTGESSGPLCPLSLARSIGVLGARRGYGPLSLPPSIRSSIYPSPLPFLFSIWFFHPGPCVHWLCPSPSPTHLCARAM